MSTLTIRNVDPKLKERLRIRAAHNGRSMEAEVRAMLREALVAETGGEVDLATAIRRRMAPLGGVDLPEPERAPLRDPPDFT
ncbi:Arc family DNA-binding protein [Amorphus sp. 3PC139-8]|uniref:FitA-like ribbon-helix-helix domain-containing protein n=1 Tax=Amorphus sp. 3PC139-8 TaxID=2735676 RepID=UPI00345CF91F